MLSQAVAAVAAVAAEVVHKIFPTLLHYAMVSTSTGTGFLPCTCFYEQSRRLYNEYYHVERDSHFIVASVW